MWVFNLVTYCVVFLLLVDNYFYEHLKQTV